MRTRRLIRCNFGMTMLKSPSLFHRDSLSLLVTRLTSHLGSGFAKLLTMLLMTVLLSACASEAAENYTISCWQNGWRKNANDKSADIFAIETNRYAMTLDVADFRNFTLGRIGKQVTYEQAVSPKRSQFADLPAADLLIEMDVDGETYRANACEAGLRNGVKRLASVRLWDSGRFVQHYDFLNLDFKSRDGKSLSCNTRLDLVAWPGSLTFNLIVDGTLDCSRCDLRIGVKSEIGNWRQEASIIGPLKSGQEKRVTMTCEIEKDSTPTAEVAVSVVGGPSMPVHFDEQKNCYVATVENLRRRGRKQSAELREYDEFEITVSGSDVTTPVPLLIDMRPPASVIGVCPILCDEEGQPMGIPVQLSKNWHYRPMGSYLMAYAMLPTTERTTYRMRIVYGFYGTLPSASHSQLCLIGYGGHGRWDQLAIGAWGETICFDMDMSLVDVAITDIRTLMTRDGIKGKKWGWTEAGWGGDWLNLRDVRQPKFFPNNLETAYVSHGPCLTDVRYEGFYGENQEVGLSVQVQTLRTDDYCRTFQNLVYTFEQDVDASKVWLYKLGRTYTYRTPQIDYGNADGLIQGRDVPSDLAKGELFLDNVELTGDAPHWISFTGAAEAGATRSKPNGYRALIVRRFDAVIGGQAYANPTISCPVHATDPTNLDLELRPPQGIRRFKKGDRIEMDIELITLPRVADDYYGPNDGFKQHLASHPTSWKTTYREVSGNSLELDVTGGRVLRNYPIVIQAEASEVSVAIHGGVGAVPIQFCGLADRSGQRLFQIVDGRRVDFDQSVHGNDFWQVDFDSESNTYRITYNLPLGETEDTEWVLVQ